MTAFSARNISASRVPATGTDIWAVITDPEALAELTPLVRSIEASGSNWRWALEGIGALGLQVDAVFTERMDFTEGRRIVFTHDPPPGSRELAGLEGVYDLTPVGSDGTDLRVDLTLSVELPLPGLSRPAVEGVLQSLMRTTGRMFAANLYERLGLDPSTVTITEVAPT